MIQLIKNNTLQLHISSLIFFSYEFFIHDLQCINSSRVLLLCPHNLIYWKPEANKYSISSHSSITYILQHKKFQSSIISLNICSNHSSLMTIRKYAIKEQQLHNHRMKRREGRRERH